MRTSKKLIIGLAVLAVSVTGMQAEELTVEYTLAGDKGFKHELKIPSDSTSLKFENPLITSLKLPEGLSELTHLEIGIFGGAEKSSITNLLLPGGMKKLELLGIYTSKLKHIQLPDDLSSRMNLFIYELGITNLTIPNGFKGGILADSKLELISIHKENKGFSISRYKDGYNPDQHIMPPASDLIKNMTPDKDGVYRIYSEPSTVVGARIYFRDGLPVIETRYPLTLEIRGAPNPLTMKVKADGLEVSWSHGILQHALLIEGPWLDVQSGDENKHFVRSPHPYGFYRLKPLE